MRTKLVVGNWKMNSTQAEAAAKVETFVGHVDAKTSVDVAVCPPFTCLHTVRSILRDTHIKLGAQDVFWKDAGAFTGQISPRMLADAGADFCIVGHSETRGRFGKLEIDPDDMGFFAETDRTINQKIKALIFHSITPILCVGETLEEREAGKTEAIIASQMEGALAGLDAAELYFFCVAYEPVWAIGTGKTCDSDEANRICGFIRQWLANQFDEDLAEHVRILYGGSVKDSNSTELFGKSDIDGGLVGGASLDPGEFSRIVMSA